MAKRIPTPGRPVIKKTVVGNSGSRTNTGVIANSKVSKPIVKPKRNVGVKAERTIQPVGKAMPIREVAKAKPKPKPKSNPYLDSISAAQKKQNDALMKMWAKDKKRKNAKIRTK